MWTKKETQTEDWVFASILGSLVYYVYLGSLLPTWDHQNLVKWIEYILRTQPQAKFLSNQVHTS